MNLNCTVYPFTFKSDWWAVFGKHIFVLFPPNYVLTWWVFRTILSTHHNGVDGCVKWSCDIINYDDKKTSGICLTCWCHLSNIMLDSIFHESTKFLFSFILLVWFSYLFVVCFFLWGRWYFYFLQDDRDEICFITITSVGLGKC